MEINNKENTKIGIREVLNTPTKSPNVRRQNLLGHFSIIRKNSILSKNKENFNLNEMTEEEKIFYVNITVKN